MKVIISRLNRLISGLMFFIRYPYVRFDFILGLSRIKLPLLLKAGSGLRLIVTQPELNEPNINIQPGVYFGSDIELNTSGKSKITIKSGTSLQDRCKIIGNVTIERNVIFAPNVYVSSGNHIAFKEPHKTIREQDRLYAHEITTAYNHIEEDVWIGVNAYIKAGVYIGRGAVIGANSVVLSDVPPYTVIAGINKSIKNRLDFQPPQNLDIKILQHQPYFYRGFDTSGSVIDQDNIIVLAPKEIPKNLTLYGSNINNVKEIIDNRGNTFTLSRKHNDAHEFIAKKGGNPYIPTKYLNEYYTLSLRTEINNCNIAVSKVITQNQEGLIS